MCLFVSRVGFCHCLTDVLIFAEFPIFLNLLCEVPNRSMVQRPVKVSKHRIEHKPDVIVILTMQHFYFLNVPSFSPRGFFTFFVALAHGTARCSKTAEQSVRDEDENLLEAGYLLLRQ